jgi:hypothetical protein
MADSIQAFQFMFEAKDMQELLNTNPTKVVCTVRIEEEITKDGRTVGALKIIASGNYAEGSTPGFTIDGCPRPPCDHW